MNYIFLGIIVIFICLLLLIYASTFFKNNSRLNRFVEKLPIASHFILALGIFLTYLIFNVSFKQTVSKASDDVDNEIIINILEVLEKNKHKCPNLIDSFFFPWQDYNKKIPKVDDDHESAALVSNYIFERVEIYTESRSLTDLSDSKFLCFFSSFFVSKLLKMEWQKYSANYELKPRLLIEELFKINESHNFYSADELREYFENYIHTDKFKEIMNAEEKTAINHDVSQLAPL